MPALSKYNSLLSYLSGLGNCAIAYSGGVDSRFLLYTAASVSGLETTAVTFITPFMKKDEIRNVKKRVPGVKRVYLDIDTLRVPEVKNSHPLRCYYCKKALFTEFIRLVKKSKLGAPLEGSNADDLKKFRPGLGALRELEIQSPLAAAGLSKHEIRTLSAQNGIPGHDAPSSPCLATRFPAGQIISLQLLDRTERAEKIISSHGFKGFRVRVHGDLARIELDNAQEGLFMRADVRADICARLKKTGFKYVSLDLEGYRQGSMD